MRITGTVITGKGEGHAYIARPGYRRQFRQRFNMQPFPGTLNLQVHDENIERFRSLQTQQAVHLSGFAVQGQTFGAVTCYPCVVNDTVEGVVVIPEKSVYTDVMEIVADVCLRDALDLHDGDRVTVTIS